MTEQAALSVAGMGFGAASGVLYGTIPQAYATDAVIAAIFIFAAGAFNLWAGAGNSLPYLRQVPRPGSFGPALSLASM